MTTGHNPPPQEQRVVPARKSQSGFPDLMRLLQVIPKPVWATPVLTLLGILSSFAEAMGITLILLFFYSMMNQLEFILANGGILGKALKYAVTRLGSPRETALVIFVLILLRGALSYAYGIVSAFVSEQISQTTRNRIHNQYLRVSYRFVQQHEQAELMQILGTESWLISGAFASLTRIMVNITSILILGGFLAALSWKIMLSALIGSLLISTVLRGLSKTARVVGIEVKRVHRKLGEHMLVTLQGMRTIRAFGQEETHQKRFETSSAEARDAALRSTRLTSLLDPLTEIGYLAILVFIIFGSSRAGIGFATTLACVALLYRLQPHLRELEGQFLYLSQIEPQLRSVCLMLEVDDKKYAPEGELPITALSRGIRFDHVSFRYQEDAPPVLDDASFEIPAGVTTALVGASGSGKTTIVNLLLRLYEPDSGVIFLDGMPMDKIRRADWLQRIAVAGQDVDLIEGNVIDNIRMADIQAPDHAVDSALEVAGISELVDSLPLGSATWIGQHGLRFSGGQRQRLGLARAVLHNPDFLILDEAMNAMDRALEQQVRAAIDNRFKGRTILLITHRLETVLDAEHVVCIDQGRIVAEGKPQELLLDEAGALSKALALAT